MRIAAVGGLPGTAAVAAAQPAALARTCLLRRLECREHHVDDRHEVENALVALLPRRILGYGRVHHCADRRQEREETVNAMQEHTMMMTESARKRRKIAAHLAPTGCCACPESAWLPAACPWSSLSRPARPARRQRGGRTGVMFRVCSRPLLQASARPPCTLPETPSPASSPSPGLPRLRAAAETWTQGSR